MNPTANCHHRNFKYNHKEIILCLLETADSTQDTAHRAIFVRAPVFASSRTPNHPIRQLRTTLTLLPVIAILKLPTSLVQLEIDLL